ncbi:putative KHDC1-like protein [Nannospalax galili]|uniref:putative KHDC1-like protein n=1 Tax=Nannospalax galili TaxID=1026970 RepID=UPI0004ED4C8D|nr:putative KHDC1-like protein [Nannospalax galili]
MAMSALGKKEWWTVPEHFNDPLVFLLDEGLEEHISGQGDTDLHRIEVHSHTFIQLERWFTASGQTRVTIVGPLRARQWLMEMIWSVVSQDSYRNARGHVMLQLVQRKPLTQRDLNASFRIQPDTWNMAFARFFGTISLAVLQEKSFQSHSCFRSDEGDVMSQWPLVAISGQ